MNINAKQLLAQTYKKQQEQTHKMDKLMQVALVVSFDNPDFMSDTKAVLSTLACYENKLIGFYPDADQAQKASNAIGNLLNAYNDALIEVPFQPDWMEDYFIYKNHGVRSAMVVSSLNCEADIADYLEEAAKSDEKRQTYQRQHEAAKLACSQYTDKQFVNDFTQFAMKHWDGLATEADSRKLFAQLLNILASETKDDYFFDSYPAQQTIFAMKDKAQYLFDSRDIETQQKFDLLKKHSDVENEFVRLTTRMDRRQQWERCVQSLTAHLQAHGADIMPKGLSALIEQGFLEDGAQAPLQPEEFKTIDFSFDLAADMNQRLSLNSLHYGINEQGHTLPSLLAGGIAAYYLTVMQYKQHAKFKALLVEHSKVMDQQPFHEHWLEMAAQSRPNKQDQISAKPAGRSISP